MGAGWKNGILPQMFDAPHESALSGVTKASTRVTVIVCGWVEMDIIPIDGYIIIHPYARCTVVFLRKSSDYVSHCAYLNDRSSIFCRMRPPDTQRYIPL